MEFTPNAPEILRRPLLSPDDPQKISQEIIAALAERGIPLAGRAMLETTFRSEPKDGPAVEWQAVRFGACLYFIAPDAPAHAEDAIRAHVEGKVSRAADYDARREARAERFRERAAAARDESAAAYSQARSMADVIPFGQPILVGHHSEKRDRRYRGRIESKFRASFEAQKKADYYDAKADSAERNRAIFSDDPLADEKLAAKIERLTARQEAMRAANRLFRKGDKDGLAAMGFAPAEIEARLKPDCLGRIGFADYELANNGANIRRLQERLKSVAAQAAAPSSKIEVGNVTIEDNPEAGRVQVFFPGNPAEEIRRALKCAGFRWSPKNGCWQSYRGERYLARAREIAESCNHKLDESEEA